MNRRTFLELIGIGVASACAADLPVVFNSGLPAWDASADEVNDFLFRKGLRLCPHSEHSSVKEFVECAGLKWLCKTCGAPTRNHIIDCSLPYGLERDRTVCFSCEPRARVILKYWSSPCMHAKQLNVKCSGCGVGIGVVHEIGKDFEYRLCYECAPEARECRRWVRDLRGSSEKA